MEQISKLVDNIQNRVSINLRDFSIDLPAYIKSAFPLDYRALYYGFYALTANHPVHFRFSNSNTAGSYFLGKCVVERSAIYKSDIRGDELKVKGDVVSIGDRNVHLYEDELIEIKDSILIKTLVHNNSHDPENLERFSILNTVSMHYANIHGTRVMGCLIEPFATLDLSICHHCVIGTFSYVQAGDMAYKQVDAGRVWVKADKMFEFNYQYPPEILKKYISMDKDFNPVGIFMDFFNARKEDFVPIYSSVQPELDVEVPADSFISPYSVFKGNSTIDSNVLVAQRAYIENSSLGYGANVQEQCYIIDSIYEGSNVTAHGGKVIHCKVGKHVFVGFNSFLQGTKAGKVIVGEGSIIMPHTIIDVKEELIIPPNSLVWGFIGNYTDLELNSIPLDQMKEIKSLSIGNMNFQGSGFQFVKAFQTRIEHILEENGAFFDGTEKSKGHAQKTQKVSFNILQPYLDGGSQGMFPNMSIDACEPF